ncbi:hypothetical protein GR702_00265 [Novosphingobium sp. FGD1]|jgi:cell wall-associated NlpC family hydrolase|uniref:NlpC/P60 domain-containing protein n=1 Tax=Novosphingobium silvae TaxID=2692619 RepID=A0A7X4GCQ3_9SPHN|nr:hypothetical protein [Novosphingobium silvae]MYL96206.1 hypothetical protein [Novosphingobium silvae]
MTGESLAAAASRLIGTPFRLHGREPHVALDCVGLVAAALAALGRKAPLPNGYALRTLHAPQAFALGEKLGLATVTGPIEPGDVLMLRVSPCQLHFAVAAGPRAIVHAHAGLRRVALGALLEDWPIVAHWRLRTENTLAPR